MAVGKVPQVGREYSVICPMCYANIRFECRDTLTYGTPCQTCKSVVDLRNPSKTLPAADTGRNSETSAAPVQYSTEVEESGNLTAADQVSVLIKDVETEKEKILPKTMTGETKQAFAAQRSQAIAEKFYFFFPLTYAIEYILFGNNPDAKIGHVRLFRKRVPFFGHTIFCVPKTSTSYAAPVCFVFASFIGFNYFCKFIGESWMSKWLKLEWVLVFFFFFFLCRLVYTDPGYIRPGYMDKGNVEGGEKTLKEIEKNQRQSLWENVNGVPMERKWCSSCEMYRPPRAAHCYLCGLCCYDHDHHCTVIGVCVGRRKVEMFSMFVTTAASACLVPALCIIYSLFKYSDKFTTNKLIASVILFLPLLFFSIMLSLTAASMWQSLASESSTRERIQGVYSAKKNPYNNGVIRNLTYHLFKTKNGTVHLHRTVYKGVCDAV
ncbi:S-acyltransferase [Angomonas deanei]|nr:S-acyltransferase [Angomonas deanei]|eukprot:EPY35873.1 S-acyltransferase [Angomonas deanei]